MKRKVKGFFGLGFGIEKVKIWDRDNQDHYTAREWKIFLGSWVISGGWIPDKVQSPTSNRD